MYGIPKDVSPLVRFITEKRGEPSPDLAQNLKTPLLVTDSKGHTLENSLRKLSPGSKLPFLLWAEASAITERLVDIVQAVLADAVEKYGPLQLYFWGGTCDVTKKVGNKIALRYPNGQNKSLNQVSTQFQRLRSIVSEFSTVTLKFIEIPYIVISQRNKERDDQTLIDDKRVENQIDSINLLVHDLNRDSGVNTLHFNRDCSKFHKRKHRPLKRTVDKEALYDGIHPAPRTSLLWIRKLQVDCYKTCYQDPDVLDITVRTDELSLLDDDNQAKSL